MSSAMSLYVFGRRRALNTLSEFAGFKGFEVRYKVADNCILLRTIVIRCATRPGDCCCPYTCALQWYLFSESSIKETDGITFQRIPKKTVMIVELVKQVSRVPPCLLCPSTRLRGLWDMAFVWFGSLVLLPYFGILTILTSH